MKESLVDIQLQQEKIKNSVELMQQAILSSSHNTDVRTKVKVNEINVDFRQQLNAVQNVTPLSDLNLPSLTDSIGIENKVSQFIPSQGQVDKQNFHYEKINEYKILNTSIHIDRQESKESKNNLSSFLSETNFSKEDLMDIFAKAIAGATTSSTSATTSSERGSAPIKLTKEVQMGKRSLQISDNPNDHSQASLNVLNGSSNSISRTVLSDESESSDSDNDNYHDYDKRFSENSTARTIRTTTIEKHDYLPETYQNQNNRPLIPQRDYHGDLGSLILDPSTFSTTTAAEGFKLNLKSNDNQRELSHRRELSGRRSTPFNGGTVKWTDDSEYQSRQSYPPPANKSNLCQNDTGREMHAVCKTVKGVLKEDEEEGDVGLYHNTANDNDNDNELQAARGSSGVYGPYGYKDSALKRTEGNIYPNISCYLQSHLARYCINTSFNPLIEQTLNQIPYGI